MTKEKTQDYERKKRYLKRYKKNKELISRLENKLVSLNDKIYRIKSPSYSDLPKGVPTVTIDDLISDKAELEARIKRLTLKGKTLKSETLEIIDNVDDPRYAEILESFFIDCKDFSTIADDTGYTERHIIRLYSEAIDSIDIECQ